MHIPGHRSQQTFTAISKPGAARGLGTETPVCCVGITFQIPQTSGFLCTGALAGMTGAGTQRPERQGRWEARPQNPTRGSRGRLEARGETAPLGAQPREGSSQSRRCRPPFQGRSHHRQDVGGERQEGLSYKAHSGMKKTHSQRRAHSSQGEDREASMPDKICTE